MSDESEGFKREFMVVTLALRSKGGWDEEKVKLFSDHIKELMIAHDIAVYGDMTMHDKTETELILGENYTGYENRLILSEEDEAEVLLEDFFMDRKTDKEEPTH